MASRAQWKLWFGTGKKPLGTQFADVFDLLFKKDEDNMPIASVTGLTTALNNKADKSDITAFADQRKTLEAGTSSYLVPAGTHIQKFFIIAPTPINLKIGTTDGGVEISLDVITINTGWGSLTTDFYTPIDKMIYFSGVAGDTTIKIYK